MNDHPPPLATQQPVQLGMPARNPDSIRSVLAGPGFVCDSKMATGVVEVTTTWLAANLYKGCSLGCVYCFRHRWHPDRVPTEVATVDEAIAEFLGHDHFEPHVTPLTVNISSTDSMHPRVRFSTVRLMRQLNDLGLTNPFGVTTKLPIPDPLLEEWSSYRSLRPVVLVSYSGMPADIEPVPREPRIDTIRRSRAYGLPVILLFKPIVEGWNTAPEQLREVLEVGAGADAMVYGGLKMDTDIAAAIARSGRRVPARSNAAWGSRFLEPRTEQRLLALHDSVSPNVPLYKHTSCAVSLVMTRPNYNDLFLQRNQNCVATCPQEQIARCFRE